MSYGLNIEMHKQVRYLCLEGRGSLGRVGSYLEISVEVPKGQSGNREIPASGSSGLHPELAERQ
jgi:hypothetical protein